LGAGVRVEQAALYYQAMALMNLGQEDRARKIFELLLATGINALGTAPDMEASSQSYVPAAQRAQVADAHFLVGLGQLGLDKRDEARQEFLLALKASPDHYAAMKALSDMGS
jgi:tetratricopeptide (TPR) repeat protein